MAHTITLSITCAISALSFHINLLYWKLSSAVIILVGDDCAVIKKTSQLLLHECIWQGISPTPYMGVSVNVQSSSFLKENYFIRFQRFFLSRVCRWGWCACGSQSIFVHPLEYFAVLTAPFIFSRNLHIITCLRRFKDSVSDLLRYHKTSSDRSLFSYGLSCQFCSGFFAYIYHLRTSMSWRACILRSRSFV